MEGLINLLQVPLVVSIITLCVNALIDHLKEKYKMSDIEVQRKIKLNVYPIAANKYLEYNMIEEPIYSVGGKLVDIEMEQVEYVATELLLVNKSLIDVDVYNIFLEFNGKSYIHNPYYHSLKSRIDSLTFPINITKGSSKAILTNFDVTNSSFSSEYSFNIVILSSNGDTVVTISDLQITYSSRYSDL